MKNKTLMTEKHAIKLLSQAKETFDLNWDNINS